MHGTSGNLEEQKASAADRLERGRKTSYGSCEQTETALTTEMIQKRAKTGMEKKDMMGVKVVQCKNGSGRGRLPLFYVYTAFGARSSASFLPQRQAGQIEMDR